MLTQAKVFASKKDIVALKSCANTEVSLLLCVRLNILIMK
jgi:hypothetical protein